MTAQTQPKPQKQTQQPPQQQMQIQLEKVELDMAFKLTRDKDEALKQIGLRFLGVMEVAKHYGGILAGEQQFAFAGHLR